MGKKSKDKRDIYYRCAKEVGWRARSAYKLAAIEENFRVFDGVTRAVDLCAAPGSWSQLLAEELKSRATKNNGPEPLIVAVDLQVMEPIEGVVQIEGDITSEETFGSILSIFGDEKADLVVCDGAPDVTAMPDFDEYLQGNLVKSAVQLCTKVLKSGGTFVSKIFRGPRSPLVLSYLTHHFDSVIVTKPSSCRTSSLEAYAVCKGFIPKSHIVHPFCSDVQDSIVNASYLTTEVELPSDIYVDCPDPKGVDSDGTWYLEDLESSDYKSRDPVQAPTKPPYAHAVGLRKSGEIPIPGCNVHVVQPSMDCLGREPEPLLHGTKDEDCKYEVTIEELNNQEFCDAIKKHIERKPCCSRDVTS